MQSDSATSGWLIEARNLSFSYSLLPAVIDVSLSLPRGAMGALIGANGSGKSTLIRLLAGLIEPARGEVVFDGSLLANIHRRDRARRIAYVPQSTSNVFPFTALEVVLTGRSPYSGRFRFESLHDEQIVRALSLDVAHLPIATLRSVRWRASLVTVARALAQSRSNVVGRTGERIDLKHRTQLVRALRNLRSELGITILTITHDLMLLDTTFDRIFAMKRGRWLPAARLKLS